MSIETPIRPPSTPPSSAPPPAVPRWPIHRLSVGQYHQMLQEGILRSGEAVELLEGWLVEKVQKTPAMCFAVRAVRAALTPLAPVELFVDCYAPVTTTDSEPEPALAVVRGNPCDYGERHPTARDVALVVEVADTSLDRDQDVKKRIYAAARIPVYWIVNLTERKIEKYADPAGDGAAADYRRRKDFAESELVPVMLEGREAGRVSVKDVLP